VPHCWCRVLLACIDDTCNAHVADDSIFLMHWQDYEAVGAELVLFGSRDGVLSGDSWSELRLQSGMHKPAGSTAH
jgi:hypothetical protein